MKKYSKLSKFILDYPDFCIRLLKDSIQSSERLNKYLLIFNEYYISNNSINDIKIKYNFNAIGIIVRIRKIIFEFINYKDEYHQEIFEFFDDNINIEDLVIDHRLLKEQELLCINSPSFSDREKFIINKRFSLIDKDPLTINEIAKEMGVSRSRIEQIENRIFKKLRHPGRLKPLKGYMSFY